VPVIANTQGQKLSKQTFAAALDKQNARDNLLAALEFLDQKPLRHTALTIEALLQSAIAHWDIDRVPRQLSLSGAALPQSCRRFAT
jgi:glutamyl-Q tRNA(Asp) synthetase